MKKHCFKINGSNVVVSNYAKNAVVNPRYYGNLRSISISSNGGDPVGEPGVSGPSFEDFTLLLRAKNMMNDNKLIQDLKAGKTAEQYFKEIGFNSVYRLSDEELDTLVYNATAVFRYILEAGKWESTVINGHYAPSVMVLLILLKIIKDGHLDKITDGESFYNFCDTFTQREYEIMMKKKKTYPQSYAYENCCTEAANRIIEILNADTKE